MYGLLDSNQRSSISSRAGVKAAQTLLRRSARMTYIRLHHSSCNLWRIVDTDEDGFSQFYSIYDPANTLTSSQAQDTVFLKFLSPNFVILRSWIH